MIGGRELKRSDERASELTMGEEEEEATPSWWEGKGKREALLLLLLHGHGGGGGGWWTKPRARKRPRRWWWWWLGDGGPGEGRCRNLARHGGRGRGRLSAEGTVGTRRLWWGWRTRRPPCRRRRWWTTRSYAGHRGPAPSPPSLATGTWSSLSFLSILSLSLSLWWLLLCFAFPSSS